MRVLVLGAAPWRTDLATRIEQLAGVGADECDPELGDCVMFVRLDGGRYDAFVFVGLHDPVTRGALAVVAERAVVVPLIDPVRSGIDPLHDGYLLRLPRALGFRNVEEQNATIAAVPATADTAHRLLGAQLDDGPAIAGLLGLATEGTWRWAGFAHG